MGRHQKFLKTYRLDELEHDRSQYQAMRKQRLEQLEIQRQEHGRDRPPPRSAARWTTNGNLLTGGMDASQLKRLKELQAENTKLKKMYAELAFIHNALQDIVAKKLCPRRERLR
jgi:hypothetical protein